MGGCRCYFRDCHVNNTKFPRMHFFRFPLKDVERYKKWRQYTKMEHIQEFPEVRRKNTSICARHFRIECFMNYKMERLVPSAVPTLMRLSDDKALDFELDNENGVLVTLEKTKYPHLIPPQGFESPLQLENDKILIEKLNMLQNQEYQTEVDVTEEMHYLVTDNQIDYQEMMITKNSKPLVNSVEILEAIQVTAPNIKKRPREINKEQECEGSNINKKCRILNSANCTGGQKKVGTIVLASQPLQTESCDIINSDDIDFVESEEIENPHELINDEGNLLLTADNFITRNSIQEDDEDIEFVEIHQDDLHYELPSNDTDSTIVQLKSDMQIDSNILDANKQKIHSLENELSELREECKDFNILQVKLSILECENSELKTTKQENEELNKKLLALQMENNRIKKTMKDNKTLSDKLLEYSEENKKLKKEVSAMDILKADLISQQQETKELKSLLETLKSSQNKEQEKRKQFDLELETERSNYLANEQKLKQELSTLKRNLELAQQKLKDSEEKLKEVKLDLNSMKNEKDLLAQRHEELEQSLNNIQNNFDLKQNDYRILKTDYDNQQQKYTVLEQKYWKLQALQNQESIVSTSKKVPTPAAVSTPSNSASSLTKAQLFNGIKRYISASMVSLLRMEMFGSSEREWKNDERQVAVDILRLGETVYKYFTDEWRFRLPALRDVRNWLSQSDQMMDEEEDL